MGYVSDLRKKVGHTPLMAPAAMAIIYDEEKRAILLERRTDNGLWCVPGGALELGEDFIDGLKREIKEETNLEIRNPELFALKGGIHMVYPNGDEMYYSDAVYVVKEFSGKLGADSESDRLCWVNIDELPEIMSTQEKYIQDFVNKIKAEESMADNYIRRIRSKVGHDKIILTFAGGCIFNEKGEVLLQRRGNSNKWGFPGGAIEIGETPQMAAIREAKEETGLDVEVGKIIGVFTDLDITYASGDQAQSVVIAYELKPVGGELYCDQVETTGLRYYSKDEKPELFTKSHEDLWNEIWK
ncbi:MAG: NUDIX domain-containing protein [Lachnospiraceae bacterium]|nr:NUDIX domain-containing protein [Lachnospiraceae bacterium]